MPIAHVVTVCSSLRVLIPCLVWLLLAGCSWLPAADADDSTSDAPQPDSAQAEASPVEVHGPTVGVAGLDVSGSYAHFEVARAQLVSTMRAARGGESWVVREISSRSYTDAASIAVLKLPRSRMVVSNTYDLRGKAQAQQANERRLEPARKAIEAVEQFALDKLPRAVRRGTDVYGLLARAAELFARAPQGSRRVVVLATDLEDMGVQGRVQIDLGGAEVFVLAFESGPDVGYTQRLKERWTRELARFGSAAPTFLDPSDDLRTALNASR